MIRLRAPKGLGDAIYLRAVALHFLDSGKNVCVFTRWPHVFEDLPVTIRRLSDLPDEPNDIRVVGYSSRRPMPEGQDEFTQRCVTAGITESIPLQMRWPVRNQVLLERIRGKAAGRKILVYQPTKVVKNPAMDLLQPRREAFGSFIRAHADYFRVKLGHPPYVDDGADLPCEMNLFGKGFIFDTFDVCSIADLLFGEVCFIHTIAEAMDKNVVCMFSRRAVNADHWVSNINPRRLFHKPHLSTAIYDES